MKSLIVTAMRNEAPYVLEWVAYHRLIGFDHFLVYSNDCTDGTDAMLDRLAALGLVSHVRNEPVGKKGIQWTALDQAGKHPKVASADWLLVADVDEFVNIKCGDGLLKDLVDAVPDAAAIALTWRLFGSNGVVGIEDIPVIAQFTRAAPFPCHAPWEASQFKTLYRNDGSYRKLGVHRPKNVAPGRKPAWVNGAGVGLGPDFGSTGAITYGAVGGMDLACLNHYSVKSPMAFLVKAERGLPNRSHKAVDIGYWADRNFNEVEDRSILRHLPDLEAALIELKANPELARLHAKGVDWHRARAEALIDTLEGLQLVTRALGTERRDIGREIARGLLKKRIALRQRDKK